MNKRVLILDAEAVQTLITSKCLSKLGYDVWLLADNKYSYGYNSHYAVHRDLGISSSEKQEYFEFIRKYIPENNIDCVIPMTDASAEVLSEYRNELKSICQFVMPAKDVFDKGYDKNNLMKVCAENSYPHPKTLDLELVGIEDIKSMLYPALIKPNHMTGGRGMTRVDTFDDFQKFYSDIRKQYGPCHLQELIPAGGRQIKVQIFLSRGTVIGSSVIHKQRYYPENGGSSCCNVTIEDKNLVAICSSVLQKIGWEGFADFDLIEDPRDNVVKVMEINPRIPACIQSAIESGMNYPEMIVRESLGESQSSYVYEPGHHLRHLGFDTLWFLYSKNRFKTKPCWFKFFGRHLSYQDLHCDDLKAFFMGTYGNIKKQMDPEFRKAKSGLR